MKSSVWMRGVVVWIVAAAAMATALRAACHDALRATLHNGLQVVIVRDTLAPVATVEMNYRVGSNEAPTGFPGMAHAVEHMMFDGSPGLSKSQLSTILANLGGASNARTTETSTQYYMTVPVQDLGVALRVESIRMRGADMTSAAWKQERGAIEQEVSGDNSNAGFRMHTRLRAVMFAGTPYAHSALGTRASFDKTTAAALKRFHDAWYVPNNAVLVIAGDVDPQQTLARVKARFGAIPRKVLPARPAFHFHAVKAQTMKAPTDAPQGSVTLAYRLPGVRDKDFVPAMVLASAMNSLRGPLKQMTLDGKALGTGFGTEILPRAGIGYVSAVIPRGDNATTALKHLRTVIAEAAAKGIPADLIEAAKRRAMASFAYRNNSVPGLANAWSAMLVNAQLHSLDDIKQAIAAVTPAQVNAFAKRLFDPAHVITVIQTPQSSAKPTQHKGFGGAEHFGGKADRSVSLPAWARRAFATLKAPPNVTHPVSFTLANGLRVIVQHESVSKTVEVYGGVRTNEDMQAPKGKKGVASVLSDLFNYGTSLMPRRRFVAAFDAIAANESGGDRFTLAVPVAHFARGMQLLADHELHPALSAKAFRIMRFLEARGRVGYLQSPGFRQIIGVARALYPTGSPQVRYTTVKSLQHLSLADVKQYYRQTFRPDMTVMVVVGDVTPAQVRKVVTKTFGQWRASGPKPETAYPAAPLNKPGSIHIPDRSTRQDSVQLTELIDMKQDNPDRYALTLGNQVLGSGGIDSRLMQALRAKRGLVYGAGSSFELDKHGGSFSVGFGCDPDKVKTARAIALREIQRMRHQPIDAVALRRAKGMLLRDLQLGESSFGDIAGQLLGYGLDDDRLDSDAIAARHYLKLTSADVQATFHKYLRPHAFVTAVQGPAPKG